MYFGMQVYNILKQSLMSDSGIRKHTRTTIWLPQERKKSTGMLYLY